MQLVVVILCLATYCRTRAEPNRNQFKEIYYWDNVDFDVPPIRREQALATGSFIPQLNGIYALKTWRDKMFVAISRFRQGTLSSLNYFPLNTTSKSPLLIPYPSFEGNYVNEDPNNLTTSLPSESSVISTGQFDIDKCNRLWVVDSGYTDFWGKKRVIAPDAIVILDLTTNAIIRRFVIPKRFINPVAVLLSITIDMEGNSCDDVHAYVTDMFRSLIVYSFKKNRAWQVEHNFMGPDPHEGNFYSENLNFQWNYGIHTSAVGEKQTDGSKRVYFAPLSSTTMYSVPNRVLQDESYTQAKYYYEFEILGNNGKDGQVAQMIYDQKTDILINTLFGRSMIACWNSRMPYKIATVHKTREIFYPIAVDIDTNRNLWILSTPLALYFHGDGFKEGLKNMRVLRESVDHSIAGTKCKNKQKSYETC